MNRDEAFRFSVQCRSYHGEGVQYQPGNAGFIHLCRHALTTCLRTFLGMPESLLVIISNSSLSRVTEFVEATVFRHSSSRITSRGIPILRYYLDNGGLSNLMKNIANPGELFMGRRCFWRNCCGSASLNTFFC